MGEKFLYLLGMGRLCLMLKKSPTPKEHCMAFFLVQVGISQYHLKSKRDASYIEIEHGTPYMP